MLGLGSTRWEPHCPHPTATPPALLQHSHLVTWITHIPISCFSFFFLHLPPSAQTRDSYLPPLILHAHHPILHRQDFPILGTGWSFLWISAENLLEWVMVVKTSPKAADCHCSLEQWWSAFPKKVGHWNAEYELCSFQRFQELLWSIADAQSPGKLSDSWSTVWSETG